MPRYPKLPCFPCPHQAACCAWGTTLTDDEARAIRREFGREKVFRTRWGEWRTRVRDRRCVFYDRGAGCLLHDKPYYPEVCRRFPWTDAETGGPYEFDQTICPEFIARPHLIRIGKRRSETSPSGE